LARWQIEDVIFKKEVENNMKINYERLEFIEKDWKKKYSEYDQIFDFGRNLGKKHLDFGCGFGAFLKILADKYPKKEFYGVDMDKDELSIGKKIYKNKNLHLSGLNSVYGKEKFDSVSFFFVLHEIEDIINVLRQVREMLNKDAKIMVYDFRRVSREKFRKKYDSDKIHQENGFEEEYREHNKWITDEFENLMKKVRFKTIDLSSQGDFFLSYLGEKTW